MSRFGLVAAVLLGGCFLEDDYESQPVGDGGGGQSTDGAESGGQEPVGGNGTGAAPNGGMGGAGGAMGGGGSGPEEPDFDAIAWASDEENIGYGIATKDTQNPLGEDVFVGYAGYGISLDASKAWVRELYRTVLRERGVRYVYAVQGPKSVAYTELEIGNSKIAAALQTRVVPGSEVILAAHSSGSYVAHELIRQLATGLDPTGVTDGKVVYFNLDGGSSGLTTDGIQRLRATYFVGARDGTTSSPNNGVMLGAANTFPDDSEYFEMDVTGSGCAAGGTWCVHLTLINTLPHDAVNGAGELDYTDFAERPVATEYLTLLAP